MGNRIGEFTMRGHQVFDAFGHGIESAGQGQDAGIRWYLDAGRKIIVAEFQGSPAQTIQVADNGPDPEQDQQAHQPVIEPGTRRGFRPCCRGSGTGPMVSSQRVPAMGL